MSFVDSLWDSDSALAKAARQTLAPAEMAYRLIVNRRNARYDKGSVVGSAIPAISIGNLTVGGTGKTPVAAWFAAELQKRDAHPAIVLRGYGDDEWRVHSLLNPDVPVVVTPDRVAGVCTALERGADCAVLDDAFQHRRISRVVDLVILSADKWNGRARLLPAGPFREPLSSLRRASIGVVTVKTVSPDQVNELVQAMSAENESLPVAIMRIGFSGVRLAADLKIAGDHALTTPAARGALTDVGQPAEWLSGRTIVGACAIGDPDSFEHQLRRAGANLRDSVRFRDHHDFTPLDVQRLMSLAGGTADVVCTLKDAVKLQAIWPHEGPPLWYVSQSLVVERGAQHLDDSLERLLDARDSYAVSG